MNTCTFAPPTTGVVTGLTFPTGPVHWKNGVFHSGKLSNLSLRQLRYEAEGRYDLTCGWCPGRCRCRTSRFRPTDYYSPLYRGVGLRVHVIDWRQARELVECTFRRVSLRQEHTALVASHDRERDIREIGFGSLLRHQTNDEIAHYRALTAAWLNAEPGPERSRADVARLAWIGEHLFFPGASLVWRSAAMSGG